MTSGCDQKNSTPKGRCQGRGQGWPQGRPQGRPQGISQDIVGQGPGTPVKGAIVGAGGAPRVATVELAGVPGPSPCQGKDAQVGMLTLGGGVAASSLALSQVWGNWLEDLGADLQGWDWFATFTFRELTEKQQRLYPGWTRIGWGYAHRALQEWNLALMRRRFGDSQPYFMAMMELQKRGVPHWHILVGNTGNERRMDWVDWWFDRYGIARILEYNPRLGARYYLGKYLTKEVADIQASPQLRTCHRSVVAAFSHDGE